MTIFNLSNILDNILNCSNFDDKKQIIQVNKTSHQLFNNHFNVINNKEYFTKFKKKYYNKKYNLIVNYSNFDNIDDFSLYIYDINKKNKIIKLNIDRTKAKNIERKTLNFNDMWNFSFKKIKYIKKLSIKDFDNIILNHFSNLQKLIIQNCASINLLNYKFNYLYLFDIEIMEDCEVLNFTNIYNNMPNLEIFKLNYKYILDDIHNYTIKLPNYLPKLHTLHIDNIKDNNLLNLLDDTNNLFICFPLLNDIIVNDVVYFI